MWIRRLFRRAATIDRSAEPTGLRPTGLRRPEPVTSHTSLEGEQAAIQAQRPGVPVQDNPILDLLGPHLEQSRQVFDTEESDLSPPSLDGVSLLGNLYHNYCKALDMQPTEISAAWVPSTPLTHGGSVTGAPEEWDRNRDAGGAISGMFADIQSVDEAFGALRTGSHTDIGAHEGVPEILRLFAPRGYGPGARAETMLPPSLTRREHHTLAIDSPLFDTPGVVETGNS
jgi:hypothetical protein